MFSTFKPEMAVWLVVGVLFLIALVLSLMGFQASPSTSGEIATTTPQQSQTTPTQSAGTKPVPKPAPTIPVSNIKLSGVNSIQYLLAQRDNNYSCSFTSQAPSPHRAGTLYLSGGKFRALITSASPDVLMVDDGKNLFTWKSGATTGLQVIANVSAGWSAVVTYGGIDLGATISFRCSPWTPDTSYFAPASGVTFYDTSGVKQN